MSFFPGGTSNFANDPSVPTGDGTIDLANVQGLKVVDGQISVYNNTPGKKISSIELSAGTEAAGSPSCSLTCSKVPGKNPNISLSRINFVINKEPVDIFNINESASSSIVNNVFVNGLLMPSVLGISKTIPVGLTNYTLDYTTPCYTYISSATAQSTIVNLILKTMPPLGNTFCTFCDLHTPTSGLTQTFRIWSADGTNNYRTIITSGLTRLDIVGILPATGDSSIYFQIIASEITEDFGFFVPIADANKMKENAEKVRKGDITPSEI